MRLLSLVLQNKKGQNIIIATSSSLHTRTSILYSNFIYESILETYRKRLKIQRTLTLDMNLNCVLSINKEYILYIFVENSNLSLAFDGIKKVNQFFNSNVKMFAGLNGAARLQTISRKFVEVLIQLIQFMSVMEEFLYTRQITIKEYLPMQPQLQSKKKSVDNQLFNKFHHILSDNDKKLILDNQIISSKIESIEVKKKCKGIDQAKKFVIKNQDELDLLEVDPEKEKYLNQYRKNILAFAMCGRKKPTINLIKQMEPQPQELPDFQINEIIEESIIEREKIKIKMNEKLQLVMQNAKIKEVLQFGQIIIEGAQKETGFIHLCNPETTWSNAKMINKRISPTSINDLSEDSGKINGYRFSTEINYKSKPILDYIIRKETFTGDKIPLLFVYSMEVSSSNIEFTFKYKCNQKWKHRLYDVDISVFLNKDFLVMDCRSVPNANSLKNNKITWKTKEIMPNSNNSKGKIILAFGSTNIQPRQILKEIKLTMKSNCGLIQNLKSECMQDWGHTSTAEKYLIIQYKISPND